MGEAVPLLTPNANKLMEEDKTAVIPSYEYKYNKSDRLMETIDPLGNIKKQFINDEFKLTKEVNPNAYNPETGDGEGISYEYDYNDYKIKTIYPDGAIQRYKYDPKGNKIKEILPENYKSETDDGDGISYCYDKCNRVEYVKDASDTVIKKYIYNEKSQIIKEIDGEGYKSASTDEDRYGIEYLYNKAGWLKEKYEPKTIDETSKEVLYNKTKYVYDNNGNVIEEHKSTDYVTKGNTLENTNTNIISYSYDPLNHLIEVKDLTGLEITYRDNLKYNSK